MENQDSSSAIAMAGLEVPCIDEQVPVETPDVQSTNVSVDSPIHHHSILSDHQLEVDGVIYRELKTLNRVVTPGVAEARLICRPNLHQFNDRNLTLDQPVKVGRSDARAGATLV